MAYITYTTLPAINQLTDYDVKEMLDAAMDVIEPIVKQNYTNRVSGKSEQYMDDAKKAHLMQHTARYYSNGKKKYVDLTFQGSVKRGNNRTRRNEIAAVLEYGSEHRAAVRFMRDALNTHIKIAEQAMLKRYNEIRGGNNNG
jgi:hypothetical protein